MIKFIIALEGRCLVYIYQKTTSLRRVRNGLSCESAELLVYYMHSTRYASVVKLVDTGDSKSPAARRAGSSPARGTNKRFWKTVSMWVRFPP